MDALSEIRRTRSPIDASAIASGGVYAWFVREPLRLADFELNSEDPVYVGRSSNLAAREYANHLSSTSTGWSTLRRSLGALLKDELHLTAVPRGNGKTSSNFTNYRFEAQGEQRLTGWMLEHLEVGVCPVDDPERVEAELLAQLSPVLNLKGSRNPLASKIRALRKTCADEARGGAGCA
ncbi:MAG: hypothetical protein IBX63_11480 [Coriobacteriia bacterium]|nr:hypothetical protein [Coriobacteriia bacterium]